MKQLEFIALSACAMTLTALGIDIMLPAFGQVRDHFGLQDQSTTTAHIITFFFMGQVAQLLFGILSDRFGRVPILRIGFPLYIVGGLAAAFAPTIELMMAARFVAGMGAAGVFTTTIAGVRDRFVGDEMARIMSLVFTIFLFTPVVAPFVGLAILSLSSWRMVFLTPPIFGILVFLWSLRMRESLPRDQRISLTLKSVLRSIRVVLTNRTFLRYTGLTTALFAALSSYVASSEHIVGDIYGRPELFVWIFAGMGVSGSISTFINSRLSYRYGARRVIQWLLVAYSLVASLLFVSTILIGDPPGMAPFFAAVVVMISINLAVEPNSSSLALEPMGDMAGIASSVYGTFFFFIGAAIGSIISELLVNGVFPLVISFFIIGLFSLLLIMSDSRVDVGHDVPKGEP